MSVSARKDGAAEITFANGKKAAIRMERGQVGISDATTGFGGTVGWLADFDTPGGTYPVPLVLIVWRAGKIVRKFSSGLSFYGWSFYAHGTQVAYHVGPLHFESKSHCELHEIASGQLIAEWDGDLESRDRPDWTAELNH